jgi:threonine aldolase
MISFESDYIAGAHPRLLQRLLETNLEPLSGYGSDPYCASAREKIRAACAAPEATVFFLTGGTQTNALAISALLRPWEGVVSAQTGHVATHEAGAIEHTGHKVLTLPQHLGKLDGEELRRYLADFYADGNHEHMVFPGMVYISHPTEYGTLYSLAELESISQVCREYSIPLYLDGARLGYGLMSYQTDLTLPDIARLCQAFYIGGTKVGALCGEALVFPRSAPEHLLTTVMLHGALMAKGRLLGVQFDELFTDQLYFRISRHAIDCAEELKAILREKGCTFYLSSPTNQPFVLLEDKRLEALRKEVAVSFWEKPDADHTVVRLATSWSTTEADLQRLREIL